MDINKVIDMVNKAAEGPLQKVDRNVLKEQLTTSIARLDMIKGLFLMVNTPVVNSKIYEIFRTDKKAYGCNVYIEVFGTKEAKAFESAINICDAYINGLVGIEKEFSKLFDGNVITIFNSRVSRVAALGVIAQSIKVGDFFDALFSFITYDFSVTDTGKHELDTPPPYLMKRVESYKNDMISINTTIISSRGRFAFVDLLKAFKQEDLRVVNDDGEVNTDAIASGEKVMPKGFFFGFNFIYWIGQQWNLLKNMWYQRRQTERDYWRSRIAYIQSKLDNMDTNDPEAIRLAKVINNYQEMITRLDAAIDKYEKGL